jgi:putative transcriptional regulator
MVAAFERVRAVYLDDDEYAELQQFMMHNPEAVKVVRGSGGVSKKLTGRALARFEAGREIWQEVLDGVREIRAGRGKRFRVEPRSPVVRARLKSGLTQAQFAALLGVSKRTLEQWEQGRRQPSGAVRMLIKVAELHPEVLREIAA